MGAVVAADSGDELRWHGAMLSRDSGGNGEDGEGFYRHRRGIELGRNHRD
jgi:hypothetical protein